MRGDIFKKTCEYILVLMMVCILFLTGCSESNDTDEDDMIKAEESSGISAVSLVIGSDNYEPYNYIDESGENVGIDVDIAKEIATELHAYMVSHIQKHLLNEYKSYNLLVAGINLLNDLIEKCIAEDLLTEPQQRIGPEGVLLVVEK